MERLDHHLIVFSPVEHSGIEVLTILSKTYVLRAKAFQLTLSQMPLRDLGRPFAIELPGPGAVKGFAVQSQLET